MPCSSRVFDVQLPTISKPELFNQNESIYSKINTLEQSFSDRVCMDGINTLDDLLVVGQSKLVAEI